MPPKSAETLDQTVVDALCTIIMQQDALNIDTNAMAAPLGISDGKNVGRKLVSLLRPYGWTYSHGSISKTAGPIPVTTVPTTSASVTAPATPNSNTSGDYSKPKKTSAKKTPAKAKAKRATPTKDEDESAGDQPPAKKTKSTTEKSKAVKQEAEDNEAAGEVKVKADNEDGADE